MMNSSKHSSRKFFILLTLILAGEVIFFLPFVIPRIFRPTLLQVYNITNFELGTYFSLYGVVAMFAYFFGGPLADRFSARLLIALALWLTSFGGFLLVFFPYRIALTCVYAYWGLTTILMLWAAMIKATREWGGSDAQGKAFGYLEGGRGFSAAMVGTIALLVFGNIFSSVAIGDKQTQRVDSYQVVLIVTSFVTFFVGILVWSVLPEGNRENKIQSRLTWKTIFKLIKLPSIWLQAIIIVCAYVGYKITDDYSLYANQVLGYDEIKSAAFGSFALWLRPIFALLSGFLADKFKSSQVIVCYFLTIAICSLLVYGGQINQSNFAIIFVLGINLMGIYGIRGIYFSIMNITGIPINDTGSAVGLMSFIGFSPEIFMSPLMGYILDSHPGIEGHQIVFLVLSLFACFGLVASVALHRLALRFELKI